MGTRQQRELTDSPCGSRLLKVRSFGLMMRTALVLVACCCWMIGLSNAAELSSQMLSHCGHPDFKEICFEDSVKSKLVYQELESAVIRCVVRNLGKNVVTWMRNDGGEIPLTVGRTVFTPDNRIMIDYTSPDEWNLVIRGAHVQDTGEYQCQVNADNRLIEKKFWLVIKESEPAPNPLEKQDIASASQQQQPSAQKSAGGANSARSVSPKSLQNDDSDAASLDLSKRSKNVHIYGRRHVFNGEQFVSFTCTAVFRSLDAKRNSAATVEWYHQGLRQSSNASSMDVSMSWKDGDTAVSVLTLYSVRLSHTGEWICLKRPSEVADGLETASHHLTVLERDSPLDQMQDQLRQRTQLVESLGLGSTVGGNSAPTTTARFAVHAPFLLLTTMTAHLLQFQHEL